MSTTKTLKVFQQGFNYSQDGQGNRLVIHLQGCNMRCPWCSNPEGMPLSGTLLTDKEWLTDRCCPKGAVKNGELDRNCCRGCEMSCIRTRQKGIRFSCKEISLDDLLDTCVRSKPMFFDGGGITLTGGEITVQFEAVKEFLSMLGDAGIHRAIESNGSHPRMAELIPLVDQWIMDIKHYDDAVHQKWTGIGNARTIQTLRDVASQHGNVLLRIPLIPDFNSSPSDAEGFARLLEDNILGTGVSLELLTYHEFGKGKWAQCGKEYTMPPKKISPETVKHFEKVLQDHGIRITHT
ncbi:MAG: glycyl-radical enzyme activating protein [Oscillospiraceae bacterium]|nr:glycyl-radical enzyme activating protein [Oscillospiraceae bacterium]